MPTIPLPPGKVSWDPKFPEIAVTPETGSYQGLSSGGAAYEPTPATSHVYGFKLMAGGFVSKFYAPSVGAAADTRAVIMVAFKPNPPKGQPHANTIASQYEYYMPSEAAAQVWMDLFRATAHPGEVVQDMIRAGIPYKRVHG